MKGKNDDFWDTLKIVPFDTLAGLLADSERAVIYLNSAKIVSGERQITLDDLPVPMNIFDRLNTPKAAHAEFLKSYTKPHARERRQVAIHGLQKQADISIANLLTRAARFHENTKNGDRDIDMESCEAAAIGEQFAALAHRADPADFHRMKMIVDNRGARHGDKGGRYAQTGIVFREFCQFIITQRALPTKKELRDLCALSSTKENKEIFRKASNDLGLSGLPKKRETKNQPES